MISAIIWNIRGVRSKKAIQRLKRLVNKNKIDMVTISEPMVDMNKVDGYKRCLGFDNCTTNSNGQIWCFWRDNCIVSIAQNHLQHITLNIKKNQGSDDMYVTVIYAKCTKADRKALWESLEAMNNSINRPWCIGGDFNVIIHPEEKLGGLPHRNSKSFDFTECMDNCGLTDIGYTRSKFTWCNHWRPSKRIWKRLDRVLINDLWAQKFSKNIIRHLARIGSDHRPMLLKCDSDQTKRHRYFKFLNFWTTEDSFMDVVRINWNQHVAGNPLWKLQQKLKRVGRRLSQWSREEIGDVYDQVEVWEAKMQHLEDEDLIARSENSRNEVNKGHAEYVQWLNKQESILKQKAKVKWFEEGEINSKYFHSVIRDRRRRLGINKIKNKRGNWISGDDKIAKAAINHYEHTFNLK